MIESPCINICTTDSESGLCIGCSRTTEEISKWQFYTNYQKKQLLDDIEKRNKNC